ncbi:hypothetical protein KC717_05245 [Candidatus Dojkabacteria bacterium]|uniref:HD domain-containing protein n=1 Tax=Candidatus Dojkabacteria bacterium TaxID=2099670 RepID=A0A955L9G4_9BACT|nr:hypothetical protein [Candidatus Dojkabacteria bacterium]
MTTIKDVIEAANELAYSEALDTDLPLVKHIDISTATGLRLAEELGANVDVVEAGTYFMDCMIGQAYKQKKLDKHVEMSRDAAADLMDKIKFDDKDAYTAILKCVEEHHGGVDFHSLESEICCNADCYRFISIEGFISAVRYLRDMDFEDLVKLLRNKVDEKWNALTLDICKEELEPQYKLINQMFEQLS